MIIETEVLGNIEYQSEDIITFEDGLYGFGGMKEFIIIQYPFEGLPFHYLQSIEDNRLSFVITSPFLFVDNYEFNIDDEVLKSMEIEKPEDMDIYSIAVIPDDLEKTTVNLRGPVIININKKLAKQYIVEEDYPYKYQIFSKGKTEVVEV